jgi:hypothetical protein
VFIMASLCRLSNIIMVSLVMWDVVGGPYWITAARFYGQKLLGNDALKQIPQLRSE